MGMDIASILDLGVPGLLLVTVVVLWREYKNKVLECKQCQDARLEEAKEGSELARALVRMRDKDEG